MFVQQQTETLVLQKIIVCAFAVQVLFCLVIVVDMVCSRSLPIHRKALMVAFVLFDTRTAVRLWKVIQAAGPDWWKELSNGTTLDYIIVVATLDGAIAAAIEVELILWPWAWGNLWLVAQLWELARWVGWISRAWTTFVLAARVAIWLGLRL